jgi:serine/threonine protein phosphatase PrpC
MFRRKRKADPIGPGANVKASNGGDKGGAPDTGSRPGLTLRYDVVVSVQTDVGCYREINEDCGRYIDPSDESLLETRGRLTVVADGMGGHSAGEVASKMAVDVITSSYYEGADDAGPALRRSFQQANSAIHEASANDQKLTGMGTTCTALVLRNGSALAAHVGDSRLYLVRGDQIYLMTEDHSAVMEMVRQGLLTLEQARHHPDKNVILRALGSHPEVEVTLWETPFPLRAGDRFLLCSDGLYDLVEDAEIKSAVMSEAPHLACERLIALAKERGGYDNITIAIVSIVAAAGDQAPIAPETRELEAIK